MGLCTVYPESCKINLSPLELHLVPAQLLLQKLEYKIIDTLHTPR